MTIKDIAKECECAVGTVSRVLNNHPDVSDKTREKVMAVVNKYGFVLNTNARSLKQQERKTLVVIVKGTSSILLNGLLEKIQKKIEPLPYNVNVVVLDEYDNEAKAAYRIYYELKPLGIIFLGGSPQLCKEDFLKIKTPCVLISDEARNLNIDFLSSVSTDNYEASIFSTEFLIKKGHRKIGIIGGDLESSGTSQKRFSGFKYAMEKNGISFDVEKAYTTSKYSFEGGAKAAKELIQKFPDVTAIFCMSDVMAIGAIRQMTDMGYKIPEQISIIGFDGIDISQYCCPRLSTIKQLETELVDKGLSALLDCIEEKNEPVHIFVPFEFIEGESVKALNK